LSIQVFDQNGDFVRKFASNGKGDGQFSNPWGAVVVDAVGKIIVADTGNHRIQVFDDKGNFLQKFGVKGSLEGQFQSPYGLALDPSGKLLIADGDNNRIQILC